MASRPYFGPGLFDFLRELRQHNSRDWFLANKPRYESEVRDPMLRFITDFGPRLRAISRHFRADPRPVGGSLFRIHRDTRFSKDKTPYKTMVAAQFRHEAGGDVHAPGFYLHLEPGQVFAGAGLWRPDAGTLAKVRDTLVAHPERWTRAVSGRAFRKTVTFSGEMLARPPRGYDPAHPLIVDLKRKDFVVTAPLSEAAACAPDFMGRVTPVYQTAAPLVEFLTRAVGLRW
jgi:uncharacterized protein (TIGR02453 family)